MYRIVFTMSLLALLPLAGGTATDHQILVVGGKVHGLRTRGVADDVQVTSFKFSPDGRRLAYVEFHLGPEGARSQPVAMFPESDDPEVLRNHIRTRLGVVTLASGARRVLLDLPARAPGTPLQTIAGNDLAWSPDGGFVAVAVEALLPSPAAHLVVVETASGRALWSPAFAEVKSAAWHPRGAALLISGREEHRSPDQVLLWDLNSGEVRHLVNGADARWASAQTVQMRRIVETAAGRAPFREEPVEMNLESGALHPTDGFALRADESVLDTWTHFSPTRPYQGSRLTVAVEGHPTWAAEPVRLIVRWLDEQQPHRVLATPGARGEIAALAVSPDERLVAFGVRRALADPAHGGPLRTAVFDVWVAAPDTAEGAHIAWAATLKARGDPDLTLRWAPDSRTLGCAADSRLLLLHLEDWSRFPYRVHAGEIYLPAIDREVTRHNLRQIGLGALMYAGDHQDTLPAADDLPALLEPYARRSDLYGRPSDPHGYLLEWFILRPVRLQDIARPAQTPMGIIPWPPGELQVLFMDGHVRTMTREDWEQFIADSKTRGDWPPDW